MAYSALRPYWFRRQSFGLGQLVSSTIRVRQIWNSASRITKATPWPVTVGSGRGLVNETRARDAARRAVHLRPLMLVIAAMFAASSSFHGRRRRLSKFSVGLVINH